MAATLNSTLPTTMVSSTILNGPNEDQPSQQQHQLQLQPTYGSTILLHETSKKGNEKSEETVHIPTSMAFVSAEVSVSEKQQQQLQPQEHYQPEQDQQQAPIFTTASGGKSCSSRIQINRTECTSAVTETVSSSEKDFHVVKIQISPNFRKVSSNSNICPNSCSSTVAINTNCNSNNNHNSASKVVDINRVNVTTSGNVSGDQHPHHQLDQQFGGETASVEEVYKLADARVCNSAESQRSSTVVIGSVVVSDLLVSNETAKSDHTSDLLVVHKSAVKSPKVSIVSFISDDTQNKCSTQADDDQCKVSVKSVYSQKKNISQTFLANSESDCVDTVNGDDRCVLLKQDSEIPGKSTTYLRPDSPRTDQDSLLSEADSSSQFDSAVHLAQASSDLSIVVEKSTSVQDQQDAAATSTTTLAISSEQSPSAHSSASAKVEKAVVSGVKTAAPTAATPEAAQVLNTCVIVDTTSEEIQAISATTTTITSNEMVQKPSGDLEVSNPTYLYYMMTSGQCSPSDTLDSGTCSDMENGGSNSNSTSESVTPPPLPKKMGPKLKMLHLKSGTIINEDGHSSDEHGDHVNELSKSNGSHTRMGSFTDSEESECSLSCDSLNSSEFARSMSIPSPPHPPTISPEDTIAAAISMLPDSLLRDIRDRKFTPREDSISEHISDDFADSLKIEDDDQSANRNRTCVLITHDDIVHDNSAKPYSFETDKFYKFHINEMDMTNDLADTKPKLSRDDETFAGYKDIHSGTSTIRSSKGTVRGVKNRVRNGIATFLQMQQTNVKNYKENDFGKVVLYTTSMGIIRETYAKCANVKQILQTLLIKFEERDVFMSCDYQQEIKERMQSNDMQVPQLFVEGQHIGDAATVERLNESGELRQMLKPYKSTTSSYTCQFCGGYRLLPCPSCNGSKKSVHRNHFTTEFVALKCMNCDEVGLVKCHNC